jgi:hypothetical protein
MALAEPPRTDERHRWCEWVARRGIDPAWIRELARAGGSETWYVVERPVPATVTSPWEHLGDLEALSEQLGAALG